MNNRFDSIIKQRNRERLEKTREYYSRPEHQNELSPANWKAFSEALADTEHDLIVYAPQYHILLPEYKKAIQEPIYQGIDLDDLFYFFDPDYVLDNMDHLPMLNSTQKNYDPSELVKPFLIPLYAKYKAMTAAGMDTATNFQTELLDQQIELEFQKEKNADYTLDMLICNAAVNHQDDIQGSLLYKIIVDALAALEKRSADSITVKRADKLEYPLDKINNKVWRLLEEDTQGQLTFAMEKKGSRKPINLVYSIDFGELEGKAFQLSKRLTAFDKRCYIAIASLYNAGNTEAISLRQIHYCMGNDRSPSPAQMQRLRNSIEKMAAARVTIVNPDDYKKYGSFNVRGRYLLAANTDGTYNIQGALTKGGISLLEEPILMQFAKKRNQLTTVPLKLLQSPINKTDTNLAIDDYLIERIRRAKRTGSKSTKILFSSLCESLSITEKKPQRILNTVGRYLDYYISCGEIAGYKIADKDNSITIKLKDQDN